MGKKFVFSVIVKSRRKTGFVLANRYTNAILADVNFWQPSALIYMSYGIYTCTLYEVRSIQAVNKPMLNLRNNLGAQPKPFNENSTKHLLSNVMSLPVSRL